MRISPVPNPQQPMMPHLIVQDGASAIAFYEKAFGATTLFRLAMPGGKLGHAELSVAGGCFAIADEFPDFGALSPTTIGGSPVLIHLYVPDVDAFVDRAVAAGATLLRPMKDEFYGDRVAHLADPSGHKWHIASRQEEVSSEEMQRRLEAAFG